MSYFIQINEISIDKVLLFLSLVIQMHAHGDRTEHIKLKTPNLPSRLQDPALKLPAVSFSVPHDVIVLSGVSLNLVYMMNKMKLIQMFFFHLE